jgi:hypothetical protein
MNKAKEIPKPQEKWKDQIDNSYNVFYPRFNKDNAMVPLDAVFATPPPTRSLETFPSEYGPYTP